VEDDDDDEDDYYADDKFVYEDVAEDPSSEDPEQKFLKEHAKRAACEANQEDQEELKSNQISDETPSEQGHVHRIRQSRKKSQS